MEKSAAVQRNQPQALVAFPRSVNWSTVLRWLGLLVFPVLLATGVDFGHVFSAIRDASPLFVIASLAVLQLSFVVRAWRWRLFCEAAGIQNTSFASLYWIQYAGLFAGAALPHGAAPFTQVIFLSEAGHSWRRGILSIVVDRLWEAFFALIFATIAAAYLWQHFPRMSAAVIAVGLSSSVALVLLAIYHGRLRSWAERHSARIPGFLRRIVRGLEPETIANTIMPLRRRVPALITSSSLFVIGQMVSAVLLARALGIDLSPVLIAMGASLIGLMMMFPISINGLGAREGILVMLFSAAGAAREEAIALGFLLFATSVISRLPGFFAWAHRPKVSAMDGEPLVAEGAHAPGTAEP